MKKIILVFGVLILLIVFVYADTSYVFKEDDEVNLKLRCFAADGYCDSGTNCQISIDAPNGTNVRNNISMTYNETSYFNVSLPTEDIGIYTAVGICLSETNATTEFTYEVTKSGRSLEVKDSIIYIIVLIASVAIFVVVLFGAVKVPWRNPRSPSGFIKEINYLKHFKISLFFLCYLLSLWILNILITITNYFLFLDISFTFFKTLYLILLVFFYPIIAIASLIIVLNIINDARVKKLLNRGIKFT